MPAPGGNFAGARSDSRGYAGNSSSSSRSGAGGGGGVRNSSSGTRESAGSQARSSSGSTGNTSRGGHSLGGGLAGPSRSGSNGQGSGGRPGAGSGPSRAGSNGGGRGLGGLASAARDAYGGGSRDGGLGRVGNVSSGYQAGGGPMMSGRNMNSLAAMNRVDRQLVDVGARLGKQYGIGTPGGIVGASEIAKTIEGELGQRYSDPVNRAAIAQNIMNRMDLAATRGRYGKSLGSVLKGYDATGYDQKRVGSRIGPMGVSAFQDTKFGTPTYERALTSLDKQMAGVGPALPDFVRNATNYHNPDVSSPSWGRNARQFGPHAFSNPDKGFGPGAVAAARNRAQAGTSMAMGNIPGMRGGLPTSGVQVAGPGPGGGQRVAEFAARGKPEVSTAAGSRVAEFAARGKPTLASSNRVAEFAARGKPAVPSSFAAGRAQEIPTPNEISRPWESAQAIPSPREMSFPGISRNPYEARSGVKQYAKAQDRLSTKAFNDRLPVGEWQSASAARTISPRMADMMAQAAMRPSQQVAGLQAPSSYSTESPRIEPASGPGFSLPGLGTISNAVQRAKTTAAPFAKMAWDNLNNPLLGLVRSPSRPRSRSGGDVRTREVQRIVAALTGGGQRGPLDFSVTETSL